MTYMGHAHLSAAVVGLNPFGDEAFGIYERSHEVHRNAFAPAGSTSQRIWPWFARETKAETPGKSGVNTVLSIDLPCYTPNVSGS